MTLANGINLNLTSKNLAILTLPLSTRILRSLRENFLMPSLIVSILLPNQSVRTNVLYSFRVAVDLTVSGTRVGAILQYSIRYLFRLAPTIVALPLVRPLMLN